MRTDEGNGPEDFVVTKMLRELLAETTYEITKWFQRGFRGSCGSPISWWIVKPVFLRNIAHMLVTANELSSVVVHMLNDTREPEGGRRCTW